MISDKHTAKSHGRYFVDSCNAAALRALLGMILSEGDEKVLHLNSAAGMGVDIIIETNDGRIALRCNKGRSTETVPVSAVRDFLGAVCHTNAVRGYFFTTSQFEEAAREFAGANGQLELIDRARFTELIEALAKKFSGRTWLLSRIGSASRSESAAPLLDVFDAVLAFEEKISVLERAGNIPGIKDYLYRTLPYIRDLIRLARYDEPLPSQVEQLIANERVRLESLRMEIEELSASLPDRDRTEYLELCERFFETWQSIQSPPPLMQPPPARSLDELHRKLLATPYRRRKQILYE